MKTGDKLVCKTNFINGREFPLVVGNHYIILCSFHSGSSSSSSFGTYTVFDILLCKVFHIYCSKNTLCDIFYSLSDFRDIKLNQIFND